MRFLLFCSFHFGVRNSNHVRFFFCFSFIECVSVFCFRSSFTIINWRWFLCVVCRGRKRWKEANICWPWDCTQRFYHHFLFGLLIISYHEGWFFLLHHFINNISLALSRQSAEACWSDHVMKWNCNLKFSINLLYSLTLTALLTFGFRFYHFMSLFWAQLGIETIYNEFLR